jgi:hypothetical protein
LADAITSAAIRDPAQIHLQDPRPMVQSFALEGRQLLTQIEQGRPGPLVQKVGRDIGHELARGILGEFGLPDSWARPATKAFAQNAARQQAQQAEQLYQSWADRAVHVLGMVSVADQRLKTAGNSQQQIERFSRSRSAAKVENRIRRGVAYLETLAGQELVLNGEIPMLLKKRQVEQTIEKRRRAELKLLDIPEFAPGIDALRFPNRAALHQQLADYPEERKMIEGAMDAFLGDSQDRFRHAASGARSALESMGRRTTSSSEWKKEIERRANKETAKMFNAAYQFLSSLTHPGRAPTKGSTELGLKQAISLVLWLAAHKDGFARARPVSTDRP